MTTETNENGEYGYSTLPPDGQTIELPMVAPSAPSSDDITVGDPVTKDIDPDSVTVYANSITPATSGDSNIVAFDVVFSVGCVCPDTGTTHTYQVVKRIGVDKMQMAHNAKMSTPVSIVEAKKPNIGGMSTSRFKALAGLN